MSVTVRTAIRAAEGSTAVSQKSRIMTSLVPWTDIFSIENISISFMLSQCLACQSQVSHEKAASPVNRTKRTAATRQPFLRVRFSFSIISSENGNYTRSNRGGIST